MKRTFNQRRTYYNMRKRPFRQNNYRQTFSPPALSKYFRFTESPVAVSSIGTVRLLTAYPMGTSEYQRSSNTTRTYNIYIRLAASMHIEIVKIPQELYVHHWFITDNSPGDAYPTVNDLFEGASPWLFHIKHDLKRRFQVKKKMRQRLFSTGDTSQETAIGPAAHCVDGKTTMWKSSVITNWKNNATGVLADIERGALLWVCVVSSSLPGQSVGWTRVNVYADFTLYFKCI